MDGNGRPPFLKGRHIAYCSRNAGVPRHICSLSEQFLVHLNNVPHTLLGPISDERIGALRFKIILCKHYSSFKRNSCLCSDVYTLLNRKYLAILQLKTVVKTFLHLFVCDLIKFFGIGHGFSSKNYLLLFYYTYQYVNLFLLLVQFLTKMFSEIPIF
ncbi:hypothetical protein KUTeg_015213 [Tegillarca granosa]|uniref:Uncharacterized protein n=1 Tax=Tegillarca granosa TaxID=220873 RepID=A0ABQ9EPH7_TEGGR|nr:hypothetical protein KUTeg_015213 [Tegillarca granosa]